MKAWIFLGGGIVGIVLILALNKAVVYTSTDEFCNACHLHPHSTESWKQSVHYITASGTFVHCVECHLPPKGEGYLPAKVVTGLRDVYGAVFKDSASLNWELKSRPENAVHFTRDISCTHCHVNLYPIELTQEGMEAHLYYDQQEGAVSCIKCHIDAGHYHEGNLHAANVEFGSDESLPDTIYRSATEITSFEDFTERIPLSAVSFDMKAIPGGRFTQGAQPGDKFAEADEFPAREVELDSFYMAEIEVTWNEFLAWYSQTSGEGRTTDIGMLEGIDGLSGATPPYGNPDQGWGKGKRPAITMTFYAAQKYCEWLSVVTGKKYRLPTEAEWEYAAQGKTEGPYFFGGDVKDYAAVGLWGKLFGTDTSVINSYVIYKENSMGKTQLPDEVLPNPFGLKNMLGNVAEFCLDNYLPDAYEQGSGVVSNPLVIAEGKEHVVRGGSYMSNAIELRISNREKTNHEAWMRSDPQMPKSLWWYSDCNYVGFRVVCEHINR